MPQKRSKVWIDRFQTTLCLRIVLYFILYQVAVWSLDTIERRLSATLTSALGREATVYFRSFLGVAIVLLGALFIFDALRMAHRLVGPLYRFRLIIKAITAGDEVELIRLRKGDHLQEMKDELNEMLKALEQRGARSEER